MDQIHLTIASMGKPVIAMVHGYAVANAFAQKFISKSPVAIRMGKNFYYQMIDLPFRQRFVLNGEIMTRLATTEDAHEGIQTFMEKRQPIWKGK